MCVCVYVCACVCVRVCVCVCACVCVAAAADGDENGVNIAYEVDENDVLIINMMSTMQLRDVCCSGESQQDLALSLEPLVILLPMSCPTTIRTTSPPTLLHGWLMLRVRQN